MRIIPGLGSVFCSTKKNNIALGTYVLVAPFVHPKIRLFIVSCVPVPVFIQSRSRPCFCVQPLHKCNKNLCSFDLQGIGALGPAPAFGHPPPPPPTTTSHNNNNNSSNNNNSFVGGQPSAVGSFNHPFNPINNHSTNNQIFNQNR